MASSQAVRLRPRQRVRDVGGLGVSGTACRRTARAIGTQVSRARAASGAQASRDADQPPSASASGTAVAEATAASPIIATMVSPVPSPERRAGKTVLTTPGSSVPARAMPAPATTVPA